MSNFSQFLDIKFGIRNNLERNSWASYFLFGVLSSLIGDTLILVASSQKCAFKINKILVTIIQHIAISDVINTITFLLPKTISLLAKSWVLGPALCYASVYSFYKWLPQRTIYSAPNPCTPKNDRIVQVLDRKEKCTHCF